MSIPKYDEMYRAFLDCLADGQTHKSKEVEEIVASTFNISATEREEMLPSGKQPLFDNRIGWTRTYLKKAGLVQSPSRGVYIITPVGQQVLAENPSKIDNLYLQRFESFREFLSPNSDETTEKAYHGSHNCHLSGPVCRCVAANRTGRGNTHANPGTRRNRPRTACHRGQI